MATAVGPWDPTLNNVVAIGVAILALGGVATGVIQKARSDRRAEIWSRVQWALDRIWDEDDNKRSAALVVISLQLSADRRPFSVKLSQSDRSLLEEVVASVSGSDDADEPEEGGWHDGEK